MKTNNTGWKKYLYSGIGLAAHSKDIIRTIVSDLAKENRLSEAEGKKIVSNAITNMESHLPNVEGKYRQAMTRVLKLANAEVLMLQKGIAKLEKRTSPEVRAIAKKAMKKVVKKSPAAKKSVTKAIHKATK